MRPTICRRDRKKLGCLFCLKKKVPTKPLREKHDQMPSAPSAILRYHGGRNRPKSFAAGKKDDDADDRPSIVFPGGGKISPRPDDHVKIT